MKNHFILISTLASAVVAAGFLFMATPVFAQEETDVVEELVIVQAPMMINRQEEGRASHPTMSSELVELKRQVSFADLDLSDYSDVMELEARIEAVANDSCEMLSDMFPFDGSPQAEVTRCKKRAVASALEQKERAIAAAQ